MRTFGSFLAVGVLSLTVACGDSKSGSSSTPGANGCAYPTCLAGLISGCEPAGACVSQIDLATFGTNTCYANGVKESVSIGAGAGISMTIKKDAKTCIIVELDMLGAATGGATMRFKDGSGNVVAAGSYDMTTKKTTVTCTGGTPVTLGDSCSALAPPSTGAATGTTTAPTCTSGTCAP